MWSTVAGPIVLSNAMLDSFPLQGDEYLVDPQFYRKPSGQQEYRLYSYLSTLVNHSIILDIGTLTGRSAVALSHNPSNFVKSYDLVDCRHRPNGSYDIFQKRNVEYNIKNVLDDLTEELIRRVSIVMLDIDHYGTVEAQILDRLRKLRYNGLVLLDDLYHHGVKEGPLMKALWDGIPERKIDVTRWGHYSGTGLVFMGNCSINVKVSD